MDIIFHYNAFTGEFAGASPAQYGPLDNAIIIPAYSTIKPVPTTGSNERAVFNTDIDDWEVKADFRGVQYWMSNGDTFIIRNLGETVPIDGSLVETPAVAKLARRIELKSALADLDFRSIRALRSKGLGRGNQQDTDILTSLDDQSQPLRDELAALEGELIALGAQL